MATRDGVGREAPGAAAASCNSNKIVACEPDPRDCTCFFSYFHQFSLTFSARCHKKIRLVGQTPETALAFTLFFHEFSRKLIDTKNCCLFDRCVSALVFYFHFLSPSDKKRWLLRSDFTLFFIILVLICL